MALFCWLTIAFSLFLTQNFKNVIHEAIIDQ